MGLSPAIALWLTSLLPGILAAAPNSAQVASNDAGIICSIINIGGMYQFCASLISEPLYPYTSTSYVDAQTVTQTSTTVETTSATITVASGTSYVTKSTFGTKSATYTAATVTSKIPIIDVVTRTTTVASSTTTVTLAPSKVSPTSPNRIAKRVESPAVIPTPLPLVGVADSLLSSACSCALSTRTTTVTQAASSTTIMTTTTSISTFIDRVFMPAVTSTLTVTVSTTTESVPVTATVRVAETTTSTTTVTSSVSVTTVTECPYFASGVRAAGVPSATGTVDLLGSPLACCKWCYESAGCDMWEYIAGSSPWDCYILSNGTGSHVSSQCPAGIGAGTVYLDPSVPEVMAGIGPCGTISYSS